MSNYTHTEGLSQVSVTAIAQDQTGFIWLGTQAGLNRFDGYEFKQFFAVPERKDFLAGNFINALCVVPNQGLWVGTSTGLSFYNFKTGLFKSFLKRYQQDIPSDQVTTLACSADVVFVGTQSDGGYYLNASTLDIQLIDIQKNNKVNHLALSGDNLFFATYQGVYVYRVSDKHIMQLTTDAAVSLLVAEQKLVIGRQDGILQVYQDGAEFELLWQRAISNKESNIIHSLAFNDQIIWTGSNDGVKSFTLEGKQASHYYHNDRLSDSLADDMVLSLAFDNRDNLWIGSESGGVNFLKSHIKQLGYVSQFNYPDAPLSNPDVRGFMADPQERIWIATTRGIYIFAGKGFVKVEDIYPEFSAINSSFVSSILRDGDDVWVATRGDGVAKFNIKNQEIKIYSAHHQNAPTLVFNRLQKYNGQILVSTRSNSILKYDPQLEALIPFFDQQLTPPDEVTDMLVHNGDLWFGSLGQGLFKFHQGQLYNLDSEQGLLSNLVFMLSVDTKNRIWASSEVGLNVVSEQVKIIQTFDRTNGLKNDAIWSLVYDQQGSVWLGTSGGLIRINTSDFSYETYVKADGTQGLEYNFGAVWLAPDGRVFIGGSQGFNQFYPNTIAAHLQPANIVLTEISILGKTISPTHNNALISEPVERVSNISLDYYQDIMSFRFASLTYSSAQQLQYYYRILGLSDTWLALEQGNRQINLLKLPPGDYQIETYATDQFGNQSDIHSLTLFLKSPWWWNKTSQFFYFASILMLLSFFVIRKQRMYRKVVADNLAMAQLQQRLELSLWASGDELWDWDVPNRKVHRYCVAARIDFGKSNNELEEGLSGEFVHPDDRGLLQQKITQCNENQIDSYEVAIRVKDFFDNWVWVLDKGRVIERDENGQPIRIVGALKDINQLKRHEATLQKLNDELEAKVAMRTQEISSKNLKLEHAMIQLKETQQELIESEKMASLGSLVAGVAHEINTPLGIAITAISYNQDCLTSLKNKLEQKTLKQSELEESIQMQGNGYTLIMKNLDRANQLISSFKQIAVDQSSEARREINLTEYLHDVVYSLKPLWKNKDIKIQINGPEQLLFNTYPGALHQIFTNLINNSVIHGFEGLDHGQIRIEISAYEGLIHLYYFDNGLGMAPAMVNQVFSPFVTSKRSQGGSGLGMHIVFNLVTQLFQGEIKCYSTQGHGIEVKMRLPLVIVEKKSK